MAARTPNNLARIERLIGQADRLAYEDVDAWRERARLAVVAVYGEGSETLARFNKIRYSLGLITDSTPASAWRSAAFGGVRRAVAVLEAIAEDIRESIDVETQTAPGLPQLHGWLGDSVGPLWRDGHHQQAVQTAAMSLESRIRAKLDVHQGSGAGLIASAFSTAPPAPGQPRFRFGEIGVVGSDAWRSAHEGAGAFGRGCMLRIRNLYSHNGSANRDEDREALMALSLLARWIDSAAVERAAET